jgi:hypothetical protein
MRFTVVPVRKAESGQTAQPPRSSAASEIPPVRDRLSTARGFVIGVAISLTAWVIIAAIYIWFAWLT